MPTYVFKYPVLLPQPHALEIRVSAPTPEAARPEADAWARQLAKGRRLGPLIAWWEEEEPPAA